MADLRVPSPDGIVGILLVVLALYAALLLGMLVLRELSTLGQRVPRPPAAMRSQLPSLLAGLGLAFFMVAAIQTAQTGRLPPSAAFALRQAQKLLALD